MKHVTIILEDKNDAVDITVYGVNQENPESHAELLATTVVRLIQNTMDRHTEISQGDKEDDQG